MAVTTPVREETRAPLVDDLRETQIRPPTAPPRESRGQPTPPRWRRWLIAGLTLLLVGAGVGVALLVSGDGATDVAEVEAYYDAYQQVLGDGADEFVAQRQAAIEDVITTIGGEAMDQLDDYHRGYGIVLLDGATPADYWEQVAEDRALQYEADRFRSMAEWSSVAPDTSGDRGAYDYEVDRFRRMAEMLEQ